MTAHPVARKNRWSLLKLVLLSLAWLPTAASSEPAQLDQAALEPAVRRPCVIMGHFRDCIAVQMADAQTDQQARTLVAAPAGFAFVYVIRPHTQKARQLTRVSLDGELQALLGPMTFARLQVPAGVRELALLTDSEVRQSLVLESGQSYFLEYELSQAMGVTRPELRVLDARTVGRKLEGSHLVQTLQRGEGS